MSHVAKVRVEVKDLDALEAACRPLGLELRRGVTTYHSYQRGLRCDHAIRVLPQNVAPGITPYEVGVVKQSNGSFALMVDDFNGGYGLTARTGERCATLVRGYATEVAKRTLQRAGYMLTGTTTKADGTIKLSFNHA